MSHKQITLVMEANTEQLGPVREVKRLPFLDNIAMVFEFLFGCWHRNLSRPFTLSGRTYEVCLNCGRKFAYSRAEIGCAVPKRSDIAFTVGSSPERYKGLSLVPRPQEELYEGIKDTFV